MRADSWTANYNGSPNGVTGTNTSAEQRHCGRRAPLTNQDIYIEQFPEDHRYIRGVLYE